jgi:ATP-binding cassette, subfamily C, bacterial LapB
MSDKEVATVETVELRSKSTSSPLSSSIDGSDLLDDEPNIPSNDELLLVAIQKFVALRGLAFSTGAIRDLGGINDGGFDPKSATNALVQLGFESSFGRLKARKIKRAQCPLIGFKVDGSPVIIKDILDKKLAVVSEVAVGGKDSEVPLKQLGDLITDFAILARQPFKDSKVSRRNDWFWGSLSRSKWLYTQVLVAAAITNFLGLSTSIFIMVVYDRVVPNEAIESLIALTVGVLIALLFEFIIKTLRAQFVDRAGKRADQRMSRLIFEKILNMRLDLRSQKSGAMASIVREFDTLREFFTSATLIAVVDLPFIFFFIWVISLIAGPLALVPLIAVPIVILCGLIIQPFLAKLAEGSMSTNMSKQGVLVETLNGLETVQATGCGRLMQKRFEDASNAQSDLSLKNRMLSQFAINSATSVQQLAQIATIFFGVFLIQDGTITMGAMIAAVILGGRTLAPLSQLASAMSRANGARQAYKTLSDVMKEDEGGNIKLGRRLSRPNLSGSIELKNLTYSFPGSQSPILKDISLKIPQGQKVAIVGRMGSGKSTLGRLISGLVAPSDGAIMIDGVDCRQIDISDLRRNIGVMLQETWLFSGSVKENLQMGYHEYPDEHILSISRVAGIDDFVSQHPSGYDLQLMERGEGLSGGQRQSISLARAMLHNPNIMILDEPTSSMDQATEKAVISRLKNWVEDRTMVMITHRNSILELADRVLVVDQGTILADTTPQKLRAQQASGG